MWNSALQEKFNFYFSGILVSKLNKLSKLSKLHNIENKKSKALTDTEISHEDFTITMEETEKYCKLKENMKS